MEFYLYSPDQGPYTITNTAELAEALASGHILLEHEDAYMSAVDQWAENKLEAAAAEAGCLREEETEYRRWQMNHGNLNEGLYLSETDYSSPEYLGQPETEEDLAPAVEVPFTTKVWTRDEIMELLMRNDKAVDRAMTALSSRDDLPPGQAKEINGYAHWVGQGKVLTGRYLNKARTLALKNSCKLKEIANG
jgi:hypothetical protein